MTTIAIDFGTSNTVISLLEPDTQVAKTLQLPVSRLFRLTTQAGDGQEIPVVPTLAFVKQAGQLVFGEPVRSQRLGMAQPERLFRAFKRELVADFQPPPRQLDGISYSAEFISEQFLKSLWHQILHQNIQPSNLVFTVPVAAFERYLAWFRALGEQLTKTNVQIVDESTAAALGYAIHHPGALVLVVDFGGGTLDLSLVRTIVSTVKSVRDRAEVVAKSDAYVGGEDIDQWIVEDCLHHLGLSREAVGMIGWQNLLELAERLKIRLSGAETAKEIWLDDTTFMSYELVLSRDRLEAILEAHQVLEQLRQALDEVLAIALGRGVHKSEIEHVLLVGGSCLIPAVQQLILSYFGRQRVQFDKPFEAVAHGALLVNQLAYVDDYLHHHYAIRLWEPHSRTYSYFPLFERGSQYPCKRAEPLILQVATAGQTDIRLDIGEVAAMSQAEVIYDAQGRMSSAPLRHQEIYRSLETHHDSVCLAHLDPPGQLGMDRIAVEFEVNAQRLLIATVRDLLTGKVLVERGEIAKLQ
ncbi:MAG: Hsp70 family protein [Oscillatoriales cyanobacterium C42_A2020_001]|nr:Hsp70 family protein [Leptolyngbyaceae cyanobacterium C42_A2020_001]